MLLISDNFSVCFISREFVAWETLLYFSKAAKCIQAYITFIITDAFPLPYCRIIIVVVAQPRQGNGGADSDDNIYFLTYNDGYKNENSQEHRLDCDA